MLRNSVLYHITSVAKVLITRSYDNGLQLGRPAAHFPILHFDTGLGWAPKAHLLRMNVPKPWFQVLPSLSALTPQALINLLMPFSTCPVLIEDSMCIS